MITAIAGHHRDAPSIIYRIDHSGKSITFSGDIDPEGLANLRKIAQGTSLLVFNSAVLDPRKRRPSFTLCTRRPAPLAEQPGTAQRRPSSSRIFHPPPTKIAPRSRNRSATPIPDRSHSPRTSFAYHPDAQASALYDCGLKTGLLERASPARTSQRASCPARPARSPKA